MSLREIMPGQKCQAKRRDGEPCTRWAVRGGPVCPTHGGNLPVVRDAAERRVEEARKSVLNLLPKAVERLEGLLDADGEAARLAAVKEVLGQAGLVIVRKAETKTEVVKHPQELALDEILEALVEARAREVAGEALGIEDAELVEEGEGGEA